MPNRTAEAMRDATPPTPPTNGADAPLPEDRAAAVQYGLVRFQQIASERDNLEREVVALKTEIAAHKVNAEGLRSQLADMESRVASATVVRDQAVADRAKYETLFISIQAQLRAFAIPAAPLVKESEDHEG